MVGTGGAGGAPEVPPDVALAAALETTMPSTEITINAQSQTCRPTATRPAREEPVTRVTLVENPPSPYKLRCKSRGFEARPSAL